MRVKGFEPSRPFGPPVLSRCCLPSFSTLARKDAVERSRTFTGFPPQRPQRCAATKLRHDREQRWRREGELNPQGGCGPLVRVRAGCRRQVGLPLHDGAGEGIRTLPSLRTAGSQPTLSTKLQHTRRSVDRTMMAERQRVELCRVLRPTPEFQSGRPPRALRSKRTMMREAGIEPAPYFVRTGS